MRNTNGVRRFQDALRIGRHDASPTRRTASASFRAIVAIGWASSVLMAPTAAGSEAARDGLAWLSRSVATVIASDESGQTLRIGSGVILSSDGFIATTDQLIEGAERVAVELPGVQARRDVSILYRDARRGLAILWTAGEALPAATLGASEWIDIGEPVLALQSLKVPGSARLSGVISGVRQDDGELAYVYIQSADLLGAEFGGRPIVNKAGSMVALGIGLLAGSSDLASAMPVSDLRVALTRARGELTARGDRLASGTEKAGPRIRVEPGPDWPKAAEEAATARLDGAVEQSQVGEERSVTFKPRDAGSLGRRLSAETLALDDLKGSSFMPPLPPMPGPVSPDQLAGAKRVYAKMDELARRAHGMPIRQLGAQAQTELYFEALRQLGIQK